MQRWAHFYVLILFGAVFSSARRIKPLDRPKKSVTNTNHHNGGRGFEGYQIGNDRAFEHEGARERNNSAKGLDAGSNQQWPFYGGIGPVRTGSLGWPVSAGLGPVRTGSHGWPVSAGLGPVRTGSHGWPVSAGLGPVRTGSHGWPVSAGIGPERTGSYDWPPYTGMVPSNWPLNTGTGPSNWPLNTGTGPSNWPPYAGIGPSNWPPYTGIGPVRTGSLDWPPNAGIGPVRIGSDGRPMQTAFGPVQMGSNGGPVSSGTGPVRIGSDGRPIQAGSNGWSFGAMSAMIPQIGTQGSYEIPSQFGPRTAIGPEGQGQQSRLTPLTSIGDSLGNLLKLDSLGNPGSFNAPSLPTLMSSQRFLPLQIHPANPGEGSSYTMVFPYPSEQGANQAPPDLATATRAYISPGTYYPTFQGNPFGPPSYFGPPSPMSSPPAQQLAYSYNSPQQFYFKFPQGNQPPIGFPTSASPGLFNVPSATFKKEH